MSSKYLWPPDRDALPAADFADPDGGRLWPVADQGCVDYLWPVLDRLREPERSRVRARFAALARKKGLRVPADAHTPPKETATMSGSAEFAKNQAEALKTLARHVDRLAKELHLGSGAALAIYRATAGVLKDYIPGAYARAAVDTFLGTWRFGNYATSGRPAALMSAEFAGTPLEAGHEARLDQYIQNRHRQMDDAGKRAGPQAIGRASEVLR